MKMNLKAKHIFIWMGSHEDSFWHTGTRQLENVLLIELNSLAGLVSLGAHCLRFWMTISLIFLTQAMN